MKNYYGDEIIDDEYLGNEHDRFFVIDQIRFVIRNSSPFLALFKLIKSEILAKFIYNMTIFHLNKTSREWIISPYQLVLNGILDQINIILTESSDLPDPINRIKFRDIRGFDFFNAAASPWFGENIIKVQSGVFWFSHIIARSLEPFIIERFNCNKMIFPRKHFKKKFYNGLVSLITEDHTISFSKFHFIFEKESIINGLEYFVLGHEYAHLLIKHYDSDKFNFKKYYTKETIKLIDSSEEIKSDSIALIILNEKRKIDNNNLIMYAPQLLFLILSFSVENNLIPEPKDHPKNKARYDYIKKMVIEITNIEKFEEIDEIIIKICEDGKKQIIKRVKERNSKFLNTVSMYCEMLNYLKNKGYKNLIKIEDILN